MRLDKLLAHMGFGTRKDVKQLIKQGIVEVNQQKITKVGQIVDEHHDMITVLGERIYYQKYVYLMLNKPKSYISATTDPIHPTVIDIVAPEFGFLDLFPVGRLDVDTTGLLLITNNGRLAHELLSPKKHVSKTYSALIDGLVTEEDIKIFSEGMDLGDFVSKPAKLEVLALDTNQNKSRIKVTISEGKFHQVKRMFHYVDKNVIELKRESMGPLVLDEKLVEGDYRELTDLELNVLKDFGIE